MRVTITPSFAPDQTIDVTRTLIAAVAYELWKQGGKDQVQNWLEAERFVASLATDQPAPTAAALPRRTRLDRPQSRPRRPARSSDDHVTGPLPVL